MPPNINANARTRRLRELNHRRHLNELAKAGYTYTNTNTNTNKIPRRSIMSPLAKSRSTMKDNRPTNPISANKTTIALLRLMYNRNRVRHSLNHLNELNTSGMTPRQLRELLAIINY